MSKTYILGYDMASDTIIRYPSKEKADCLSEEWVSIDAESEQAARDNYEPCFLEWQGNQAI